MIKNRITFLFMFFPLLIFSQSKEIEMAVDNFWRIYFNANEILPTKYSEASIDFWGRVFSEKKLNEFTACLEVSYCDFELEQNLKIAEQRSDYILSRFVNDYHINREEINISFVVNDFCIEGGSIIPSTTCVVLYKK